MTDNCAIIPKVINKNGQKVDSKLFADLLSYTNNNRPLAVVICSQISIFERLETPFEIP